MIPSPRALQQVAVTGQLMDPTSSSRLPLIHPALAGTRQFLALSFSLVPPVSQKLIEKIEAGNFIDMSELLSDHMGVLNNEDSPRPTKTKRHNVTNILEWARCFAIYISILNWKQPQQVPDLLGYQFLILLISMAYEGDGWQGYDRVFRQHAAANSLGTWPL